jgi:hypothetical protein
VELEEGEEPPETEPLDAFVVEGTCQRTLALALAGVGIEIGVGVGIGAGGVTAAVVEGVDSKRPIRSGEVERERRLQVWGQFRWQIGD